MENKRELFSKIPKVDELLQDPIIDDLIETSPREIVLETVREKLDTLREQIKREEITRGDLENSIEGLPLDITRGVNNKMSMKLRKVINGTGVIIHTNLGRSLINKKVMENVYELATNYSNLEFNLESGTRGSRYSHVEEIIKRITGAESALVVNNNAAAVMLVLSSLAKGKEVVVSRGELVEIGGSFRVPDVMEQSGAKLVDVGTTNKTHGWDYKKAIGEDTAALMKVHTSNYRILGFTESVALDDLVEIGKNASVPVIEDLGSGVLVDLSKYGLEYEPTVQDSVKAGVDIITFSGDKLLGGPQAGIIIGNKQYIDIMKKNPLTRALRVDKFTLSSLEATLRLYLNEEEAVKHIPTLRMITVSIEELEKSAKTLLEVLEDRVGHYLSMKIVDTYSQVGGGSMPLENLPTKSIMFYAKTITTTTLEKRLRDLEIPIITRVYKDRLYIDVRTVTEEDFSVIAYGLQEAVGEI